MTYRPLNEKTNRYVTQNGSYTRTDGEYYAETDKGTTKKLGTSGTPHDFDIDDLTVVDGVSIYFVVKIEDNYYTSKQLKDDLVKAETEKNPYFSLDYVNVVEINQDRLDRQLENRRDNAEQSAGVSVTQNLNNPIDIVKQINWTTRPVSVSDDDESHVESIGQWSVNRLEGQSFDFNNSVRVTEPDPRSDLDEEDVDEDIDETDDSDGDDSTEEERTDDRTTDRDRSTPKREQPRGGGRAVPETFLK